MTCKFRVALIVAILCVTGSIFVRAASPVMDIDRVAIISDIMPDSIIEQGAGTNGISSPAPTSRKMLYKSLPVPGAAPLSPATGDEQTLQPPTFRVNAVDALPSRKAAVNFGPLTGNTPSEAPAKEQMDALVKQSRATAEEILARDRAAYGKKGAAVRSLRASAASMDARVPRKMELGPLPDASAQATAICPKTQRADELRQKVAQGRANVALKRSKNADSSTDEAALDADRLALAGYLAGQGAWGEVRDLLVELQQTSTDPGILFAVGRNLEVADMQVAIIGEKNPAKRSELELGLGQLHRELGHEQAAKRMLAAVKTQGATPDIRKRAAETLALKAASTRPPVPPGTTERLKTLADEKQGKEVNP